MAMLGPTLLDLQQQTNSDTETISRLFIGRSTGYLVGSAVGGFLYDHFAPAGVMGVSLVLMGVGTLAVPWCHTVLGLSGAIAGQGVAMGLVDTGKLFLWFIRQPDMSSLDKLCSLKCYLFSFTFL